MTVGEHGVLVVEDDAMVRAWVRLALRDSEFSVAGEAEDAATARQLLERRRPAVLLVDYRLPDKVGTELVRDLRMEGVELPIVVMTANNERGFNEGVRKAGGQGTVLKTGSVDELLATLRGAIGGDPRFDPRHPPADRTRASLSPREREVLRLVAGGATNKAVAAELGVAEQTVKTLIARAFSKLGTSKRAEAVARAHTLGIL
jgi:DNA-binding NarL/FixJ family response regulator